MKVGDYVIVPATVTGTGENIKATVIEIEPGFLNSAQFVTCLYLEPPITASGETRCVCYDWQLDPYNE